MEEVAHESNSSGGVYMKLPEGIQQDWKFVRLGDVCSVKSVFDPMKRTQGDEQDTPYIALKDFRLKENEVKIHHTERYVTAKEIEANRLKTFPKDTIIFSRHVRYAHGSSPPKKNHDIRILTRESVLSPNLFCILPTELLIPEFIFYTLQGMDFTKLILGVIPNMTRRQIEDLSIPLPSLDDQEKLISTFTVIDEKIANLEHQVFETKKYKRGLLHKIFNKGSNTNKV
jgi:type I restriction enzyme, S subunit